MSNGRQLGARRIMTGLAFTALKEGASPDAILAELRESVGCFGGLPDAELEQLARMGRPELERLAEERGIQTKPRPKPATVTPIKPGTPLAPVPPKPKPEVPAGVVIEDLPIEEFAAVHEEGADPLLGSADDIVIPENGDVMCYGDGGAGKTTLMIDLACHAAAGDPWLGIPIPRPLNVGLIENEGPRPPYRLKLARKLAGWQGSPIEGRVRVVNAPWAKLSLAEPADLDALAVWVKRRNLELVIIGPLSRSGMSGSGLLVEVNAFMELVRKVRELAERRVAFVFVHHENRAGQVSGAWEGSGDTLLHVTGQGNGRTRLFFQKARWSSAHHAKALKLIWTDGEGFAVDEAPELDDEEIGERIVVYVSEHPGTAWKKVEKGVSNVNAERRRAVRDRLFDGRVIVNVVKRDGREIVTTECEKGKTSRLYLADDPTIADLGPDPDEVGTK